MSVGDQAEAFLRIDKLIKDFGAQDGSVFRAVDGVSLDIVKGEIFALLGPSGCGKTSLLRMLGGFDLPTSGRIMLGGQDQAQLAPYQRPINMMFQSYALFPHLSVWDNIAFGLKREGLPKAQVSERVDAMLKLVQLGKFAHRKPHQLSGGQQQRVALARSLAKQPKLLLLDEPLGALDKKLREETQIELVNIIESVGVTCVMVTHDQEEAMAMASRIGVMSEGRILQVGTPREVYAEPADMAVAQLFGTVSVLSASAEGDVARCVLGVVPVRGTASGDGVLLIRPADLTCEPVRDDRPAPATVRGIEFAGDHLLVTATVGDDMVVVAKVNPDSGIGVGDGREAVGHDQGRAPRPGLAQGRLDRRLGAAV